MDFSSTLKRFNAALTWPMNRGHLRPVGSASRNNFLLIRTYFIGHFTPVELWRQILLLLLLSKVSG